MRISNILVIAATFLSSAHLAIAEDASFAFTEEKLAEAEAAIYQQYLVRVKGGTNGANILRKLQNGQFDGVELVKVIGGKIAVVNFDGDESSAAFLKAANAGIQIMEHGE